MLWVWRVRCFDKIIDEPSCHGRYTEVRLRDQILSEMSLFSCSLQPMTQSGTHSSDFWLNSSASVFFWETLEEEPPTFIWSFFSFDLEKKVTSNISVTQKACRTLYTCGVSSPLWLPRLSTDRHPNLKLINCSSHMFNSTCSVSLSSCQIISSLVIWILTHKAMSLWVLNKYSFLEFEAWGKQKHHAFCP